MNMAQKTLNDAPLVIEEFDQANNLVATYVTSRSTDKGGRIDVIVTRPTHSSMWELNADA